MVNRIRDFNDPDDQGHIPDLALIGTTWRHHMSGGIYTITGYAFSATHDLWEIKYTRSDFPVEFTRTIHNFFGIKRPEGVPRFSQVT